MMKPIKLWLAGLVLLMGAVVTTTATADTRDIKQFSYDGSYSERTYTLNTIKEHTEYREEVVDRTCYRREIIGYRRYCETRYYRECFIDHYGRQICRNVPRQHCWDQPIYRDVPYTCRETIRVPYQVKDYDVKANIKFEFGDVPANTSVNEQLAVSLEGERLSLRAINTRSLVLMPLEKEITESQAGGLKTIDATYKISFIKLTDLSVPLAAKPKNIAVARNGILSFDTNRVAFPELFKFGIVIKKNRFWNEDETVADVWLNLSDLDRQAIGSSERWGISLSAIGYPPELRVTGKHTAIVKLRAMIDTDKVLNAHVLPQQLEVEAKKSFNIDRNQ